MDGCCAFIIGIAVIAGAIWMFGAMSDAEKARKERNEGQVRELRQQMANFHATEDSIVSNIRSFFTSITGSYDTVCREIVNSCSSLESCLRSMIKCNDALQQGRHDEDYRVQIQGLRNRNLPRMEQLSSDLFDFGRKVHATPRSLMMGDDTYGQVNKAYWDEVTSMSRNDVENYINHCANLLDNKNSTDFSNHFAINVEKVLKCVWFFATEKTFSATDFQCAVYTFQRIYKLEHVDIIIADLYAKKKMGGEDVLRNTIHELLTREQKRDGAPVSAYTLTRIASALMWMNAYQSENAVLQYMLTSGKEMTAKTQERLHSLTNGGGKAPSGFEVKSRANELYFDVSALAWKDDEYIGLFENLAFQDKILSYSLALREENKDLFIPQGVQVPGAEKVLSKLNAVFAEEYGSGVTARTVNCIALSGSGEEKMDGILASSGECKQMGVLIHIARIGKKLIIKFYTLFMPEGTDLAAQKQQALSMYKKLSPTVTMWEGSLKDTMLMAVEQLLNTAAQSGVTPAPAPVVNTDETVF